MPYPGATPVTPVDKQGNVIGGSGGGATSQTVQGGSADNTADTTNTLKVGGLVNTTAPTQQATGVKTPFWVSARGSLIVGGLATNGGDGEANTVLTALTQPSGGAGGSLLVANKKFNGTTWDRDRKANAFNRVASSAAAGNPAVGKAAAGDVMQFWGQNGAAITYLQIYNKATAPVIGTDTPVLTYPIPANATFSQTIPNGGAYLGTGIAYAFTTDAAGATGSAAAAVTAFNLLVA